MTTSGVQRSVRRVRPFTPSQESPAVLSERTVGRDAILEILVDRLTSAAASGNRAHSLLVGPRGAGKTHLINVALHRALQRPEVKQRLTVVRFDEDAVGITRYHDILQEVLANLSPMRSGNRRPALPANPEEAVAAALGDKVLVLVLENLDRIFHAFGEPGQQDFRSWVENSGQIIVLATTPLLFPGVSDRALPWWGNFGISHLEELDVEQGRKLLISLARGSGDAELADFLTTGKGEARLRAINALAGGSPRIWMILSECLTVELLDELVPAVEALLEGLVPYYQQLLWDLSPIEQRLIRELADGPHQAATVAELAKATGIEQRVAASTLGRLADIRWVRAEKVPELDKRSSWYRLREPMLRHHFHYRSAVDQPLPLIVEILRAWYDRAERMAHLATAAPESVVERLMAAALSGETGRFDVTVSANNVEVLAVNARRWVHGDGPWPHAESAGALIDVAVSGVQRGAEAAAAVAVKRPLDAKCTAAAEQLLSRLQEQDLTLSAEQRVAELLRLGSVETSGRTSAILELVSACWDGTDDALDARDRLLLASGQVADDDQLLGLDLRRAVAHWSAQGKDAVTARDQFADVAVRSAKILGTHDVTTLTARQSLAYWTAMSGDSAGARSQFQALLVSLDSADEIETAVRLYTRFYLALWTDDLQDARKQFAELLPVVERDRGPQAEITLLVRATLAEWTGFAGDPAAACDLAGAVLVDLPHGDEFSDRQRESVRNTLRENLLKLLERSRSQQQVAWTDPRNLGLTGLLQAAAAGSAEALIRLPSELADIVSALRSDAAVLKAPHHACSAAPPEALKRLSVRENRR